jgi:hypothetical protein
VCALGPSSHTVDTLEAMLNAGMVGARIDLTWGGLDFHRESLKALNVSTQHTAASWQNYLSASWELSAQRSCSEVFAWQAESLGCSRQCHSVF